MIDILTRYLPLLVAAICAILLGMWIVRLRKEKRKEFLSNILRLVIATLLSFSIALFSQSLSSKRQAAEATKTTVARLVSVYNELKNNRKNIDRLESDYARGSVENIQVYLPRTRHLVGFVGCESYYRWSLDFQTRLGDTLHKTECLLIRIDQTGARVADISNIWEQFGDLATRLERCMEVLKEKGEEMHKPTWDAQLGISAEKGLVWR